MSNIGSTIKYVRISPRKLRVLLYDIKKMSPVEALGALMYSRKRGALVLLKAIKSALASSKNSFKGDENLLQFKTLTVDEGPVLKRSRAGGKGTMKFYKRRSAHIRVELKARELELPKPETVQKAIVPVVATNKVIKKKTVKKSIKK